MAAQKRIVTAKLTALLQGELPSATRLRAFPKASGKCGRFFPDPNFVKHSQKIPEKIGANAEKRIDNPVSIL
jgi:hypothetical protein